MKPAVVGTRNALNAAREAGVKRFVYTSTVWAVGLSTDPEAPLTADDWNDRSHNPYALAKTRAEREAWELAARLGVPMISLCPNGVLGPYDYGITPSTETLRDLVNGRQITVNAGFAFVDARDVGEIHARAVDGGELGKRYLISGENLHLRELRELLGRLTGFKPWYVGLGRTSLGLVAAAAELVANVTRTEPLFTRAFAHDVVERYMYTECRETWEAFSYEPRPAAVMLADAIRWLLYIGAIRESRAARFAERFPPDPAWPPV